MTALTLFQCLDVPENITTKDDNSPRRLRSVKCAECGSDTGLLNSEKQSINLFKWQVNCQTTSSLKAPSASECLAATLLASLSRSGSSKAVIYPISRENPGKPELEGTQSPSRDDRVLHVWILNPNISYTSSEETCAAKNAIKLLYRIIDHETADKIIEPVTSDVQDLSLPHDALNQSIGRLEASNQLFPQDQRRYNDFRVGLLNRYEIESK